MDGTAGRLPVAITAFLNRSDSVAPVLRWRRSLTAALKTILTRRRHRHRATKAGPPNQPGRDQRAGLAYASSRPEIGLHGGTNAKRRPGSLFPPPPPAPPPSWPAPNGGGTSLPPCLPPPPWRPPRLGPPPPPRPTPPFPPMTTRSRIYIFWMDFMNLHGRIHKEAHPSILFIIDGVYPQLRFSFTSRFHHHHSLSFFVFPWPWRWRRDSPDPPPGRCSRPAPA